MGIHTEHNQDKSIIFIEDHKLIGDEAEAFHNFVQQSIENGSKNISIDLSNVEFISSWGIGLLVHAYTTCSKNQISFSVNGVKQQVLNLLNQIKLTELFNIN